MKTQVISIVQENGRDTLKISYEKIGKVLSLDLSALDASHAVNAKHHGWKQRFGDLKAGDETGHEKFAEAQRLYEHLKEGGDWAMTGQRDTTGIVIEALIRLGAKTSDGKKATQEQLEKVAEVKPELVKSWRANPDVKATIAKIYAERAAKAAKEVKADEIKIDLV